ncbi:hypothetical protein E8P82_11200 [Arthrobacter echini]|uniref:DUF8083 domain-containing protein n=1 Tax=Arthrobacter echini TaxID=1529066 RepID=A0A4S5E399_9MICC|nr:hypothetical protein [Arthrobacter echini]THJ65843.1 hypothetical protein E8P82_11200 [Arthrobacter echini]
MVTISGSAQVFPYVSHLRVYEPLEAFSDAQQLAILAQRTRERSETDAIEHEQSLRRILRTISDPFPHHEPDLMRITHFPTSNGSTTPYYCPNQLAVRTALAAESLDQSLRGPLIDVLVPEVAREAHQARLDPETFADSVAKLHTRSATWGVPFAWFALIHEDDLTEVVEDEDRVTTVRITARIGDCIDRGKRSIAHLAVAAPEMDLFDEITELVEWLGIFRRDAVVEVDYGPVAERVFPDDSPSDVRLGIESLAEADMLGAAAAYRRLASRWIPIRQLARAS